MSKKCIECGKKIGKQTRGKYCYGCKVKREQKEKIEYWLKTGDTGCHTIGKVSNCIREYIYKEQKQICNICGITNKWNGKKLNFILDHIDGDASNNRRENLRLICPNCDSQLDTFKSKNKHSARIYRNTNMVPKSRVRKEQEEYETATKRCVRCGKNIREHSKTRLCKACYIYVKIKKSNKKKLGIIENKKYIYENENKYEICPICNKNLKSYRANMCIQCSKEKSSKRRESVGRDVLKDLIRTTPFQKIGKMYGVSDKAIVKWCISYNLPSKKSEINKISDDDWTNI